MSYGPLEPYSITMPSGGTSTASLDIARSWKTIYLEIPSMTSNSELYINGSTDNVTFRMTYHPQGAVTAPIGVRFLINSAVTNAIVPIPNGVRYIKIESSATINNGCVFKVLCSD